MGPKPFVRLATPREVLRPEFPQELVQFYAEYEAVEFGTADYGSLYLLPLRDVKRVKWADLGLLWDRPEGWDNFDGFQIGGGCFGEDIVCALNAPNCQPGAILALGGQVFGWGLGGTGPFATGGCLVLGVTFLEWLRHLEEYGWWEHAIGFGIPQLPAERQRKLRAYYLALNPNIEWSEP